MGQAEYIVRFKGDYSALQKDINKIAGETKKLSDDEVIIKLAYDGNIKEFNKVFNRISEMHPELGIQFQYNVNQKILEQELDKLNKLTVVKLDIDSGNVQSKLEKMADGIELALQDGLSKDDITKQVNNYFAYYNTAIKAGAKHIDIDSINNRLYDAFEIETDEIKKIFDNVFDRNIDHPVELFKLDKAIDEELINTKSRVEDLEKTLTSLEGKGASKIGLPSELQEVQDEIKILRSNIQDMQDQLQNLSGESFDKITESIKETNSQLNNTIEKIKILSMTGTTGFNIAPLKTILSDFSEFAQMRNGNQLSDYWGNLQIKIDNGDESLKKALIDLKLFNEETGKINILESGDVKSGGLTSDDYTLLATKKASQQTDNTINSRLQDTIVLKDKLDEAADAGVNVARILNIVYDKSSDTMFQLQETAKGTMLGGQGEAPINLEAFNASDEAIQKLISDILYLRKIGVGVDFHGLNVFYDEISDAFSLIDMDLKPTEYGKYGEDDTFENDILGGLISSFEDKSGELPKAAQNFVDRVQSILKGIDTSEIEGSAKEVTQKAADALQLEVKPYMRKGGKIEEVDLPGDNHNNLLSEGATTPSQQFDNTLQKDLVYLENYKNTIEEINQLKLQPKTDETEKKLQELQKLADYFFGSISIAQGEWGNDGCNFVDSYNINYKSNLRTKGYGDAVDEIWDIGRNKPKLNVTDLSFEFEGIGEEISRIESKSESLRQRFTKDLAESRNFVEALTSEFKDFVEYTNDVKTEQNPSMIEAYNKDIEYMLQKFPVLEQFRNKFTSRKEAHEFVKTDKWKDFLATLPQSHTYLESIGYDFNRINQASNENNLSLGTATPSQIDAITQAEDRMGNEAQEATDQAKQGLAEMREEAEKTTKSIANVLMAWNGVDTSSNERFMLANSQTGYHTDPTAQGDYEFITQKLVNSVIKNAEETVDTMIHTHPNKLAAFSHDDIFAAIEEMQQGIVHQYVKADSEVSYIDFSKLGSKTWTLIAKDFERRYNKLLETDGWNEGDDVTQEMQDDFQSKMKQALKDSISFITGKGTDFASSIYKIFSMDDIWAMQPMSQSSNETPVSTESTNAETKALLSEKEVVEQLRAELNLTKKATEDLFDQQGYAKTNNKYQIEQTAVDELITSLKEKKQVEESQDSFITSPTANAMQSEVEAVNQAIDAEKKKFDELKNKISKTIPTAINKKNQAFEKERDLVARVVDDEVDYFDVLKDSINGVTDTIEKQYDTTKNAKPKADKSNNKSSNNKSSSNKSNEPDKDALLRQHYVDLRKDTYQSFGQKSDIQKEMSKYYSQLEKESSDIYSSANKKANGLLDKIKKLNFDKYTQDFIDELKSAESELTDFLNQLNAGTIPLDKIDEKISVLATNINDTLSKKALGNVKKAGEKTLSNIALKIDQIIAKNSAMGKQYEDRFKGLRKELEEAENVDVAKRIIADVNQLESEIINAGKTGVSFIDQIKQRLRDMNSKYIAQYFSFQDIIRYARQAVTNVVQLNDAFIELSKVSNTSLEDLESDFQSYANTAKDIGGTITDTISATADWSRLGYNVPDSKELAEVAMLYKNVGDGIDINTANESLISTLRGFKMEADDAISVVDKFNEVSNNFAISSGGIGESLQRSAAAFSAANTDLSQSIALITATNETVQDPDAVGSMWTTVSARIRGAKSELEDMGEDTEDMVESTSKLRDLIKGITGVDIMLDENTFKDIYTIITQIGDKWNEISDIDQAALLEALAGKRQANRLAAVLGNLDHLKEAYQTAEESAGSARREQENFEKGITYSINQAKATLEELSYDAINSDFLKGLVNTGTKLLEIIDKIIDKFGLFKSLIVGGAAVLGSQKLG